jgi:hypothetical protein
MNNDVLTDEVKKYISKTVLCWLATCDKHQIPNVSPKEIFTYKDDHTLLIANLASPKSIQNIGDNKNVCVSFIDIFVQKGFKINGVAQIINKEDESFMSFVKPLTDLFTDQFPIQSVIVVKVTNVEKIVAPSYWLYKETTEASQIDSAMKTYQLKLK